MPPASRRVKAPSRRFSSTVRSMNVPRPSGACAMPSLTMSSVARPSIRWPAKRTSPVVFTMPQTARRVVVLPAPLAPRMVVMPPASTANARPCSTVVHPYWAWRSAASSRGGIRSLAQIRLDHFGVPLDLAGRTFRDLPAEIEDHDAVGDLHHQIHVVLDEENRH